jgi:hypothetical protein
LDNNKLIEEETRIIAPCGIYCGACDAFLGNSKKLAQEIYRIQDGSNLADVGPVALGLDQEKVKDFLKLLKKIGKAPKCPGCLGGGGNPMCAIKNCTKEKGFLTCAECDLMPCSPSESDKANPLMSPAGMLEMITRRYSNWNFENLKRIKEIGYRKFIDEMQEKVQKGFMTCDVISKEMVFSEALQKMQGKK